MQQNANAIAFRKQNVLIIQYKRTQVNPHGTHAVVFRQVAGNKTRKSN